MKAPDVTLYPGEAAMLRKLLYDAQSATRSNLKAYNYCRRALVILQKAERRRDRKPRVSKLLLDEEIINEINTQTQWQK